MPIETGYPEAAVNPPMDDMEQDYIDIGSSGDFFDEFRTIEDLLNAIHGLTNIAEEIKKDKLDAIGRTVVEEYELDRRTRAEWEENNKTIFKLAKLTAESKEWAGLPVHNIKYPLIANAAIQYNSRSMPEVVKGNRIVKPKVIGRDDDNAKMDRGKRVAEHMSYQLLDQTVGWEEDTDFLLIYHAIIGAGFRKTYYCSVDSVIKSDYVTADNLVADYKTQSIEKANRITEILYMTKNEIIERMRSGVYLECDLNELGDPEHQEEDEGEPDDPDAPHVLLEQHRYLDLDGDGYAEPYVVLVHRDTGKVFRIAARFDLDGIKFNEKGEIVRIEPVHYYTRYLFLPDPEGGFYGMGFGTLLWPLNEAINTIVNQLLDAGMAATRGGGFIDGDIQLGRNRGQHGNFEVGYGQWVPVKSRGKDIKNGIVPLPVREPSLVLFQLLGFMVDAGKELSSQVDVLSGESPGTHVPAQSTLALIEQGLKVYSAIMKRTYRGLKSEYQKVWRLNRLYLPQEDYSVILDDGTSIGSEDYQSDDFDIVPVADPNNATESSRLLKAEVLRSMLGVGLNDKEIHRLTLEAAGFEKSVIDRVIPPDQEGPSPMEQLEMAKLQAELYNLQAEGRLTEAKIATEQAKAEGVADKMAADAAKLQQEQQRLMQEAAAGAEDRQIKKAELAAKVMAPQVGTQLGGENAKTGKV